MINFDAQMRKAIKAEQKRHVTDNFRKCVDAYLLYGIVVVLLYFITMGMTLISVMPSMLSTSLTLQFEAVAQFYRGIFLYIILMIIIGSPLAYGLQSFLIKLTHNQNPSPTEVFYPFHSLTSIWRSIRIYCALLVRSLQWYLPVFVIFCVPATTLAAVAMSDSVSSSNPLNTVLMIACNLFLIIVSVLLAVRVMCYSAAYVIMQEDETIGAWSATQISNSICKGHFKALLAYTLSFLPWLLVYFCICAVLGIVIALLSFNPAAILGIVVCVILIALYLIFVSVYMQTTFYAIFDELNPVKRTIQDAPEN